MFRCSLCEGSFSRKDALKRHMQTLHGFKDRQVAAQPPPPPPPQSECPPPAPQSERPPPPPPERPQPPLQQDFMFQHPFTANVSGPTSCGKTYFVMTLLQHCKTKIFPPPKRILWLYKR